MEQKCNNVVFLLCVYPLSPSSAESIVVLPSLSPSVSFCFSQRLSSFARAILVFAHTLTRQPFLSFFSVLPLFLSLSFSFLSCSRCLFVCPESSFTHSTQANLVFLFLPLPVSLVSLYTAFSSLSFRTELSTILSLSPSFSPPFSCLSCIIQ